MTRARVSWIVLSGALVFGGAAYLYDPPWVGQITSGLGEWRTDPSGMRYRWTNGHATFFVPSEATAMMLPLRAQFPGPPAHPEVTVQVSADDRWLSEIVLEAPDAWVRTTLPLPRRPTRRRYRRVDLRIDRTIGQESYGVQVGEIMLEREKIYN